ncbi:MAG: hypothetical protein R3C61_26000 [Bacteroidia bacterium]
MIRGTYGETLGKLRELQQAGLIRHLGLSEVNEKDLNESVKHIDFVSVRIATPCATATGISA